MSTVFILSSKYTVIQSSIQLYNQVYSYTIKYTALYSQVYSIIQSSRVIQSSIQLYSQVYSYTIKYTELYSQVYNQDCTTVVYCVLLTWLSTTEQLLRQREDGIRIYLQQLHQQHFNEDDVIAELQTTLIDLAKSRLAIPQVVELQDLSVLNREARERASVSRQNGVSHESIHVRFSDWTPSPDYSAEEGWV